MSVCVSVALHSGAECGWNKSVSISASSGTPGTHHTQSCCFQLSLQYLLTLLIHLTGVLTEINQIQD